MIDMAQADRAVAQKAAAFDASQREFHHARDELDRELWTAFRRLWPGKAGDRISANVGGKYRVEGRAVILRNGTTLGLYVDTNGQRCPVVEPYASNAVIIKRHQKSGHS